MKILFRVDAGDKIGLGHFFRSLNLANQLNKRGHEITFSFLESSFWESQIASGFIFKTLVLKKELSEIQMETYITQNKPNLFYVDGIIEFSKNFLNRLRKETKIVFYQNISESRHFCDIFILPSIYQKESFFKNFKPKTKVFKGLDYLIFHPTVCEIKKKTKINSEIKSIAVTAGGSDPKNTLKTIYELLQNIKIKNVTYSLYFGQDYVFKKELPKKPPDNLKFLKFDHKSVLTHDIVISAFGVSAFEFLYLGIPVISFGHKESNAIACDNLAQETNALISLGQIDYLSSRRLEDAIKKIMGFSKRKELVKNAKNTIDIQGINRVIKILEEN